MAKEPDHVTAFRRRARRQFWRGLATFVVVNAAIGAFYFLLGLGLAAVLR